MNDLLKNVALGAAGGLAGTYAMSLYWKAAQAWVGEDPRAWTQEGAPHALDEMDVAGQHHEEGESSTAAMGREAYEAATGEEPSDETKTELSQGVHWSYGTLMGGLYGAWRGRQEGLDAAGGLTFGTALWLLGDELAVPLLGLAQGATAFPPAQHAHRLGAHLAYGLAAAATAQAGHVLLFGKKKPPATWGDAAWEAGKTYAKWKAGTKAARTGWRLLRR